MRAAQEGAQVVVHYNPSLDQARALIERAIDKAEQLGLRGSVAVVGDSGVLVSASRMDASGAGGMARSKARIAGRRWHTE